MNSKTTKTYLITQKQFEEWTSAWAQFEFQTGKFNFFMNGDALQTGVIFEKNFVNYLVSTTGASTIKIRFGFDPIEKSFEIILFGTDNTGQVLTPYYVPSEKVYYSPSPILTETGRVPQELVRNWRENWIAKAETGDITSYNFMNA